MSAQHPLLGARIRRIDAPSPTLYCFTLSSPSLREVLAVSLAKGARGVGLVQQRPLGLPANALVRKLRKELEGGAIQALVRTAAGGLELHVRRGESQLVARFELSDPPDLVLIDTSTDRVLISLRAQDPAGEAARRGPARDDVLWADELDALRALGPRLLDTADTALLQGMRQALLRGVRTARQRLQRRHAAISAEVERATLAPALRAEGTLLLAHLGAVRRGADSVELLDYTQDPPQPVTIPLDPALGVREQAEARFHKARRYERGATVAAQRLAVTEHEQAELERLATGIEHAADREALDALSQRTRALGVRLQQGALEAGGKRKKDMPRPPYRSLRGERDREIRVGRGAAHNDALTLHHARPHDLWLHARDTTGAHVIVPLERGENCPPGLLRDAALLAAHFSGVRGEPLVDVIYAERRHVRKPRGAAAGSVNVDREKVFRLQLDPERLRALLATELPEP